MIQIEKIIEEYRKRIDIYMSYGDMQIAIDKMNYQIKYYENVKKIIKRIVLFTKLKISRIQISVHDSVYLELTDKTDYIIVRISDHYCTNYPEKCVRNILLSKNL